MGRANFAFWGGGSPYLLPPVIFSTMPLGLTSAAAFLAATGLTHTHQANNWVNGAGVVV